MGTGIGVYGKAGAGGWAGYFDGNVYVSGRLFQGGAASPQATSAQTVESFGEAQLVNGAATVPLDQETAAAIGGGKYHVVVTEIDDHNALFVTKQGPQGFEVRAKGSPSVNSRFHYRVMARGKPSARQAAAAEAAPQITMPKDVPVPTPPELPKPGESRPERQEGPDPR